MHISAELSLWPRDISVQLSYILPLIKIDGVVSIRTDRPILMCGLHNAPKDREHKLIIAVTFLVELYK